MYLVVGADGFVGSYVVKNILSGTEEKVLALGLGIEEGTRGRVRAERCDITRPEMVERVAAGLAGEREIKAVYLAAYHHPDEVRENPGLAWDINVTALSRFLNVMPGFRCLFYVSTEMVYGSCGLDYRFKESDRPAPANLYGRQKAVAESVALGYGYHVVRFPFLIGKSILPGRKHFYDEIVETVRGG